MNSIINKVFVPPIADIIFDYYYPDYKKHYDAVVRDINWVAGDYMRNIIASYDVYLEGADDDAFFESLAGMIRYSYVTDFNIVLCELMRIDPNIAHTHSRFWH